MFTVTGGTCRHDFDRSVPFDREMPGGYFAYYRGLYFHENQWDGIDVFWLGVGKIVVSHKVNRRLKKHKIGNVRFDPLSDIEVSAENFQLMRDSERWIQQLM